VAQFCLAGVLIDGAIAMSRESLVGRDDDLEILRDFLRRARENGGSLLLSGQAGIGKTALLDAAVEAARAAGTRVLLANGVELEVDVGFAALNQILLPLLGDFHELNDVHRAALEAALGLGDGPDQGPALVADAAAALLRNVATAQSLLIAVDDLQWVDRSSAAVLARLAGELDGSHVGFLAAFRSEAGTFFESSGLPSVDVRALDEDSAAVLLGTRFPLLAARVHRRVLRESQGNPLVLLELPSALSASQQIARAFLPTPLPLTGRLQSLFASRVAMLPAVTRRGLLLTALEGSGDLRRLLGESGEFGAGDLRAAELAQLVTVEHGTLQLVFRHPLVRSTVVEIATSDERRHAHALLAGLLAAEPDRRAWHLAEATIAPDEQVAALLEQAARRIVRRGDAAGSVTALVRAADLSPHARDRCRRLVEAASISGNVAGDLRNASHLLRQARLVDPDLTGSLDAAVAVAGLLFHGEGDIDIAHRLLVSALADRAAPLNANRGTLTGALPFLIEVCLCGGRPELWEPLAGPLAQLDQGAVPMVRLNVSVLSDPARATAADLQLLDEAIKSLAAETDPMVIARISAVALFVDRSPECRDALRRVIRETPDGGAIVPAIKAMLVLSADAYLSGRWDEADTVARAGLRLCEAHGYQLLAAAGRPTLALLAAARGDDSTVRTLTGEVSRWAARRGLRGVQFSCSHARGLAAVGHSDFEDAYRHASGISPPGTLARHVPHALWSALDLIESAVHTGRSGPAADHVRAMQEAGLADVSPRLALVVAGSAAMAAPDHRAIELFDTAVTIPGAGRWPFDLARVQLAYGERLRRMRATAPARLQLSAAHECFERLGAVPWVRRASQELNATSRTKSRATGGALVPLTPQEHEVAMLAASGLSNKQIAERLFVSHRTVGAHLRQVFLKLEITSRAGLRDALRAREQHD
jgi:DNA-binding CsgD family transcriptional regulator